MEKITYVAALSYAIENLVDAPAEVIEKLSTLRMQTEKRNSAEKKPTKTQVANEAYGEMVLEVLRNSDKPLTITQIMDADETLGKLNNQKVSAVVRGLGDKVVKTIEKRKSYFALA